MYVCIYIYVCIRIYIYVYIYTWLWSPANLLLILTTFHERVLIISLKSTLQSFATSSPHQVYIEQLVVFPFSPSLDRSEGVYSYWWRVVHSAAGHPGRLQASHTRHTNDRLGGTLEGFRLMDRMEMQHDATAQEETRSTYKVTGVSIAVSTGFLENQTYLSCSKMENEWKRLQICYSKYC